MKHPQNSRGAVPRLWRSRRARWATASIALLSAALAGYGIRAARASGIPSTQALTYAGVLEDGAGAALTGAHNVQVAVYDAATAGNLLCQMAAAQSVTLTNGRFVVSLPDSCAASFGAKSDTWVDVAVDGASTGRSKVGVVPYAIEANHAVSATSATGSLLAQITQMQTDIGQERVVRANIDATGTIALQTGSWISLKSHVVGSYALSFAAGTFSSAPTCVAMAVSGNQVPPAAECYSESMTGITCRVTSTGSGIDCGFSLICIGAK